MENKTLSGESEVMDEFGVCLSEYGTAIVKSTMDHDPEDSPLIATEIVNAKEELMARYKSMAEELKQSHTDIQFTQDQNNQLLLQLSTQTSKNTEIEAEVKESRSKVQDLEIKLEDEMAEKKIYKELSDKTLLDLHESRRENEILERENSGKRHRPEEIWEKVEAVKMKR